MTHFYFNHRLCSSASPVLMATGFVNGKRQFSTPLWHQSTGHQNISHKWLGRRYLQLCQIRCTYVHGGLLGTKLFMPFFEELTYKSDPLTDFRAWWLKRRGLAQGCACFGICSYGSPFRGSKPFKNPNFGAWIGVFKPNSLNWNTFILSKLLHRFQPNFAQW